MLRNRWKVTEREITRGIKTKWRPMDAGWGKYKGEFILKQMKIQ